MEAAGGKKKMLATLVGCNYADSPRVQPPLHGCINDVHAVHAILLDRFGFAPGDITVLTDDHEPKPTGVVIMDALRKMVKSAAPGDMLFFHFSGHGTEDAENGHGKEAIVPWDGNYITDVDIQDLMASVPRGATFTMVADSCFSGGLFDQEKEQIGPHHRGAADRPLLRATAPAARFIPYATMLAHLSAESGLDASHHIGAHLVALFGDDASPKFRLHHHNGNSNGVARTVHAGILLSGCQANEMSTDLPPDGTKPYRGALTDSLKTVLNEHPAPISNQDLVRAVRKEVRRAIEAFGWECDQHPCLYCSDANVRAPFLGQQDTKAKIKQLSKEEEAAAAIPTLA